MLNKFINGEVVAECNGVKEIEDCLNVAKENGIEVSEVLSPSDYIDRVGNNKVCFTVNVEDIKYLTFCDRRWYEKVCKKEVVSFDGLNKVILDIREAFLEGKLAIKVESKTDRDKLKIWCEGMRINVKGMPKYENDICIRINVISEDKCIWKGSERYYNDVGIPVITYSEFAKDLFKFKLKDIVDNHLVVKIISKEEAQVLVEECVKADIHIVGYVAASLAFKIISREDESYLIPCDVSLLVDTMTIITMDEIDFSEDAKEEKVDNEKYVNALKLLTKLRHIPCSECPFEDYDCQEICCKTSNLIQDMDN